MASAAIITKLMLIPPNIYKNKIPKWDRVSIQLRIHFILDGTGNNEPHSSYATCFDHSIKVDIKFQSTNCWIQLERWLERRPIYYCLLLHVTKLTSCRVPHSEDSINRSITMFREKIGPLSMMKKWKDRKMMKKNRDVRSFSYLAPRKNLV